MNGYESDRDTVEAVQNGYESDTDTVDTVPLVNSEVNWGGQRQLAPIPAVVPDDLVARMLREQLLDCIYVWELVNNHLNVSAMSGRRLMLTRVFEPSHRLVLMSYMAENLSAIYMFAVLVGHYDLYIGRGQRSLERRNLTSVLTVGGEVFFEDEAIFDGLVWQMQPGATDIEHEGQKRMVMYACKRVMLLQLIRPGSQQGLMIKLSLALLNEVRPRDLLQLSEAARVEVESIRRSASILQDYVELDDLYRWLGQAAGDNGYMGMLMGSEEDVVEGIFRESFS